MIANLESHDDVPGKRERERGKETRPGTRQSSQLGKSSSANKAGYTATSYRWVSRGRKARVHTFPLDHYGPTDRPMDRQTDGWTKPLIELRVRN